MKPQHIARLEYIHKYIDVFQLNIKFERFYQQCNLSKPDDHSLHIRGIYGLNLSI